MQKWQRLGNYHLLDLLGRGGFAEVYLGLHVYLSTPAAIKVLHTRLTSQDQQRFLAEARMIARLDHPNIVRVLDFGVEADVPFLVIDYAPLGNMRAQCLPGSRLSPERLPDFVRQVAEALQYAHDRHVIHRDVKPDNMLLKRSNHLLLSDFGIAVGLPDFSKGSVDVAGTPDYTAPEQLRGQPSPASDQYALGVVAYEWLTGERPFAGSVASLIWQHQSSPPPPLREKAPEVGAEVEQVVLRALAKDPAARWPSAVAFADALQQAVLATQQQRTTRVTRAFPIVAALPRADADHPLPPGGLLWNVPYRRNPFFTGREAVLEHLHAALRAQRVTVLAQPRALSGLGGIGKTQTAVEYAYRYRDSYQAVFWARAESREALLSDLAAIGALLQLPEKAEQDLSRVAAAVKQWLQGHEDWLLVLDNVEDLGLLAEFLPSRGTILLTTRSQVTGGAAQRIDLEEMIPEEGALLLMRRARLAQPGLPYGALDARLRAEAKEAAELLDGLPLALDQAGAYIEEAGCTLFDYLDRYRERRADLLRRRGSHLPSDHPEPVATTWSLSFEKVEQANRLAADLLRLCAFLAPDAIPEEILSEGARELGPSLAELAADRLELDESLRELRKFSLIRRFPETRTLSIHRLVQAVLRDSMEEQDQGQWMERAVRAVNRVFPEGEDVAGWPQCERCLPQVLSCAALIEERSLVFPEAARLLNQAGLFLLERAQYTLAEHLLRKALAIRTLLEGSHAGVKATDVAESLNDLGALYASQGEYAQAEPLLVQALVIHERALGAGHPDVATATNNVAMMKYYQGKLAEAEPLFLRSLAIWQQQPEQTHPDYARTTSNLALLYLVQGRYSEAEPLYRRALSIWEGIVGPEHPDVARTLNNLGKLYRLQGQYAQAEPLLLRARTIREKTLGPDHPGVAQTLLELALLFGDQGRYAEAEPLYQLALEIREEALGPAHPAMVEVLEHYATLLGKLGRPVEAAQLEAQIRSIRQGA